MHAYEDDGQSKNRSQRRVTYFCRLCREYGIVNRKAHLKKMHNASYDVVNKRSSTDMVKIIFVEAVTA